MYLSPVTATDPTYIFKSHPGSGKFQRHGHNQSDVLYTAVLLMNVQRLYGSIVRLINSSGRSELNVPVLHTRKG